MWARRRRPRRRASSFGSACGPAALDLWGIGPDDPRRFLWQEAFWNDGVLFLSGLPPLPQETVAARAHAIGAITGAMAHAFSRWAWAQAAFPLDGLEWVVDLDALAVRRGGGAFKVLDRSFTAFPPASYNRIGTAFTSGCGTLVKVEIEKASGAVRVVEAYSVLECGSAHPRVGARPGAGRLRHGPRLCAS